MIVPLVFLDIDGVINDIGADRILNMLSDSLEDRARRLGVDIVTVRGRPMAVPVHVPSLIQALAANAETWWCTTWRRHANGPLTDHLDVGPFPVVDPYGHDVSLARKVEAATPMVPEALESGREVVWSEDFNGAFRRFPEWSLSIPAKTACCVL